MTIDVHGTARIDPMQMRNCVPMVELTLGASRGRVGCVERSVRAAPGIDAILFGRLVLDAPQ